MKLYLLPILILLLAGCNTNNQAESNVNKYLLSTLNTPDSYKPVSFSPIKKRLYCDAYKGPYDFYSQMCNIDPSHCDTVEVAHYKSLMDKHATDSTVYNYHITHTYKFDNGTGSVVTQTKTFVLDTNYNVLGLAKED